uniref:Secreted protein n=1 Tax=Anopheles darlingi TaxID=43151 RepID=A0A2M4DNT5_ANODA
MLLFVVSLLLAAPGDSNESGHFVAVAPLGAGIWVGFAFLEPFFVFWRLFRGASGPTPLSCVGPWMDPSCSRFLTC